MVAREHQTAEKRSSSATVQVHLEDANDNWPEFSKDAYRFNVSENAPRDTYINIIKVGHYIRFIDECDFWI